MRLIHILYSFLLITITSLQLNAQGFGWAKNLIGSTTETYSAADAEGNVYLTGSFYSQMIFGDDTLTSKGGNDFYLVKFNSEGNVIWAKSGGGNGYDKGTYICSDANGNIYMTGSFKSSSFIFADKNLINYDSTMLSSDIFIVKYDKNGNEIWGKSYGGSYDDAGSVIATDNWGNVYVTGSFESFTIGFGDYSFTNANQDIHWKGGDIFLIKYDSNGTLKWAKNEGAELFERARALVADVSGNIYLAMQSSSSVIKLGTNLYINQGLDDSYLIKYDQNGNVIWVNAIGAISYDWIRSVSIDSQGYIYVTGGFYSSELYIGSLLITNANRNSSDIFIAKLNSQGEALWVKTVSGFYNDLAVASAFDKNDNLYVCGYTQSYPLKFEDLDLLKKGGTSMFVLGFTNEGKFIRFETSGGGQVYASTMSLDTAGNLYVTGYYDYQSASFGDSTFYNNGAAAYFVKIKAAITAVTTEKSEAPDNFNLFNNYPNPFNPATVITFSVPRESNVRLIVYNSLGEAVKELTNEVKPAGTYNVNFNAAGLSSGVYFYSIKSNSTDGKNSYNSTKKMILLK